MSAERRGRSLVVTGASGFVGRRLLARVAGRYDRIAALSRSVQPPLAGVTWVQGDIREPAGWEHFLDATTDVAHLAAATGGASASVHRAVNAEGTEALVRACERRQAAGLLFVSSIAARFPEDPRYPYATAKREAEVIVRGGKVPFVIVRPTIVLGRGSPILQRLRTLAGGPVIAAIGGGTARVQPVDVEDLAAALARLLELRRYDRDTLEFGGPEALTMLDLLVRVRAAMGKSPARAVAVPYAPMRGGLIALEVILGGRSPVNAGQLSSFVQDGTADRNAIWDEMRPHMMSIERMVRATGDD